MRHQISIEWRLSSFQAFVQASPSVWNTLPHIHLPNDHLVLKCLVHILQSVLIHPSPTSHRILSMLLLQSFQQSTLYVFTRTLKNRQEGLFHLFYFSLGQTVDFAHSSCSINGHWVEMKLFPPSPLIAGLVGEHHDWRCLCDPVLACPNWVHSNDLLYDISRNLLFSLYCHLSSPNLNNISPKLSALLNFCISFRRQLFFLVTSA